MCTVCFHTIQNQPVCPVESCAFSYHTEGSEDGEDDLGSARFLLVSHKTYERFGDWSPFSYTYPPDSLEF